MTQDKELLRRSRISKKLKGRPTWNKGRTIETDPRIEKIRFWLGKKMSEETKNKISLANIGRKMSKVAKEKMRISKIGSLNPMFGKKQSPELVEKRISKIRGRKNYWLAGEKNHNWKGGITFTGQGLRRTVAFSNWRKSVFKRDNFTCLNCGNRGGKIVSHHIKEFSLYPELRFDIDNGVTLCVKCHKTIHTIDPIKWGELGGSPKG